MSRTAQNRAAQKQQTRQRILDAAGRGFRSGGFGGVGVDALAKEAGVTSGAFYVHFDSKAAAFCDAVDAGMQDVVSTIAAFQRDRGKDWWPAFVRTYLGAKRKCALPESCALQSLSPEVARADAASREHYASRLREIVETILAGPVSAGAPTDEAAAWAALSTLIGSVTLARAVPDEALAERIAEAAAHTLLAATNERKERG